MLATWRGRFDPIQVFLLINISPCLEKASKYLKPTHADMERSGEGEAEFSQESSFSWYLQCIQEKKTVCPWEMCIEWTMEPELKVLNCVLKLVLCKDKRPEFIVFANMHFCIVSVFVIFSLFFFTTWKYLNFFFQTFYMSLFFIRQHINV